MAEQEAELNRRSITEQMIVFFEERMKKFRSGQFPPPFKTRTPLTDEFIDKAKKECVRDCGGLDAFAARNLTSRRTTLSEHVERMDPSG